MTPTQFYTAVMLGIVSLIFSVVVVCSAQSTQRLRADVQSRQAEINRGTMMQQLGGDILKAMAVASLKDEKMKALLAKNGYTVTVNNPKAKPAAPSAPAVAPAPALR